MRLLSSDEIDALLEARRVLLPFSLVEVHEQRIELLKKPIDDPSRYPDGMEILRTAENAITLRRIIVPALVEYQQTIVFQQIVQATEVLQGIAHVLDDVHRHDGRVLLRSSGMRSTSKFATYLHHGFDGSSDDRHRIASKVPGSIGAIAQLHVLQCVRFDERDLLDRTSGREQVLNLGEWDLRRSQRWI